LLGRIGKRREKSSRGKRGKFGDEKRLGSEVPRLFGAKKWNESFGCCGTGNWVGEGGGEVAKLFSRRSAVKERALRSLAGTFGVPGGGRSVKKGGGRGAWGLEVRSEAITARKGLLRGGKKVIRRDYGAYEKIRKKGVLREKKK